jgi:hypothetical protein
MSELKVNKVTPRSGTTVTLGDSGDTITIPSGVTITNSGTATGFAGVFESQLLHVRDEKASNTEGGAASATTSHTRVLNTIVTNEISGASLASNQITLPSGTYFIMSRAPAFMVNQTKSILYNTTDSSNTVIGSSGYADVGGVGYFDCFIFGRFTIGATKVFEIRHYTAQARASNGLGVKTNLAGVIEVYTDVQIWKVA